MIRLERKTTISIGHDLHKEMLIAGSRFDINKGGYYDSSGGVAVNVWCSPEDKPSCWDKEISRGNLNFARDFVGTIRFELLLDGDYRLELEASPYGLRERNRPTNADLESCLDWIATKAMELLSLSDLSLAMLLEANDRIGRSENL